MNEVVIYNMLLVVGRMLLFAIPRLLDIIKKYFIFSAGTYRKMKRKTPSILPALVWVGLFVLAPALVAFIVCILVLKIWNYFLIGLFLVCMVLSWIYEKNQEIVWLSRQELEQIRLNVRDEFLSLFHELDTLIPIKKLYSANEITAIASQKMNGVVVVSILVLKSGEIMKDDYDKIKAQIQVVLNRRLVQGLMPGFPCYSYDTTAADDRDRILTLAVESVNEVGVEFEIDIIIANNQTAIEYARSKRKPPPSNPGQGNDRDF